MKSIKALILAAFAAAALAAFPAAAVSAEPGGFVADEYPATLDGSQISALALKAGGVFSYCAGVTFEGTLSQPFSKLTTSQVTDPTGCSPGALSMNGCQLKFDPGSSTVDIVPPECGPITLPCAFKVPSQTGISAEYENVGSASEAKVRIAINDASAEYIVTSSNCKKSGTYNDLLITGSFEVTATNGNESPIGTEAYNGGLFLTGGAPEGGEPRLAASRYPAQVTGERIQWGEPFESQLTLLEYTEKGINVKVTCAGAEVDGGELSAPVYNEFALDVVYSECVIGKSTTMAVDMNSCHYRVSELEGVTVGGGSEMNYESEVDLECDEGDAVTISGSGCTFKIPGQTLAAEGSGGLTNVFFPEEAVVTFLTGGENVAYTTTGVNCQLIGRSTAGSYEDGTSRSDLLLRAEY